MTVNYYGNVVDINYEVKDSSGAPITNNAVTLRFPPVRSKNPNVINPLFDNTKKQRFTFIITKFGQIPDPHYFDKAFEPILVVGDDGKKYNTIPSDQFK